MERGCGWNGSRKHEHEDGVSMALGFGVGVSIGTMGLVFRHP